MQVLEELKVVTGHKCLRECITDGLKRKNIRFHRDLFPKINKRDGSNNKSITNASKIINAHMPPKT